MVKKFDDMFTCFAIIHERDRRTDERTETVRRYKPRLCTAARGKNVQFRDGDDCSDSH